MSPLTWSGPGGPAARKGSMTVERSTTSPSSPLAFHSAGEQTPSAASSGSTAPSYIGLRSRVRVMMYSGSSSRRLRLIRA